MGDHADHDRQWDAGWDGHERAQMLRLGRMSMIEKLAWLEEAHRMVLHMQRSRQSDAARDEARPGEHP